MNQLWCMHFSEGSFWLLVFKHYACFPIASQLCKIEHSYSWIFLHKYDQKMNFNKFLEGIFLIQTLSIGDLPYRFYDGKSEEMDGFKGAISLSFTIGFYLHFLE